MAGPLLIIATRDGDAELLLDALGRGDGVWTRRERPPRFEDREGNSADRPAADAIVVATASDYDDPTARFILVAAGDAAAPQQVAADRVLRVEREALLVTPADELRRICAFAGIPY